MKAKNFVVRGKVQGVGFRAATEAKAKQLGVNGWVQNLASGAVEVLASGNTAVLDEFATWLESGPDAADVSTVQSSDATTEVKSGFSVRY